MPTDFSLLDSVYPLPREQLYRQWLLSRDASSLPAEWKHRDLSGWTLAAHPDAHVCSLEDATGEALGWVIQPMLQIDDSETRRPVDSVRLHVKASNLTDADVDKALYGRGPSGHSDGTGLEGMWVTIVISGTFQRVYLGPIHSVVYNAEMGRVATTHNLLEPFERDVELSRAFDLLETNRYFSFGLTAFQRVQRLLPNHYLDLEDFTAIRHWPKAALFERTGVEGAAKIADHCRHIVDQLAERNESIEVPLSAGNDSRAVLSFLKSVIAAGRPPVRLFTAIGLDFSQRIDLQGASRLARIVGLPLDARPRAKHSAAPIGALMRNFARIGEAKSGPALSRPSLLVPPDPAEAARPRPLSLAGMGGETGRAFYWPEGAPAAITAEDLLRRVDAPIIPKTIAAAQAWIDGLPDFVRDEAADALDLAYVEQRLGCWESNSRYLYPGRPNVISPMASGFSIERMLALPQTYRRSGMLQRDISAHAWPELLAVPINRATGALLLEQKGRGLVRRIKRVGAATRRWRSRAA